jgi:TonB family protein
MDIDNPYLKNFVFKYSDAKNTPVEEHREIAEVEDDADISPDSDSSESKSNDLLQDSTYVEIKQQAAKEAEEVDKEVEEVDEVIPFAIVEEKPRFQGKDASEFVKWIYGQLDGNYPQEAVKNNIQGKVYVSFTVNVDGTLSDIRSIRKTDPILEECIIGIVKKSPKWTPGRRQNKPVKVTYQVPIQFRL